MFKWSKIEERVKFLPKIFIIFCWVGMMKKKDEKYSTNFLLILIFFFHFQYNLHFFFMSIQLIFMLFSFHSFFGTTSVILICCNTIPISTYLFFKRESKALLALLVYHIIVTLEVHIPFYAIDSRELLALTTNYLFMKYN